MRTAYAPDLPRIQNGVLFFFSVFMLVLPFSSQNAELNNRKGKNNHEQDHGHCSRETQIVRKAKSVLVNAQEHRLGLVLWSAAREELEDDKNLKGGNDRQNRS